MSTQSTKAGKTVPVITPDQVALNAANKKAQEIGAAMGNKRIVPIVIKDMDKANKFVVGYMLRPDLTTQLRLADRGQECATGFSSEEASKVLQALLLPNESDPRINTDTEEGEMYWKGALLCLMEFLKSALPVIKKK